jgi:lactate dehydrogenase-like 2-hydroxyacid dehydrogenase
MRLQVNCYAVADLMCCGYVNHSHEVFARDDFACRVRPEEKSTAELVDASKDAVVDEHHFLDTPVSGNLAGLIFDVFTT